MIVRDQGARDRRADLPVVPDRGAEGQDALHDPGPGARAVGQGASASQRSDRPAPRRSGRTTRAHAPNRLQKCSRAGSAQASSSWLISGAMTTIVTGSVPAEYAIATPSSARVTHLGTQHGPDRSQPGQDPRAWHRRRRPCTLAARDMLDE